MRTAVKGHRKCHSIAKSDVETHATRNVVARHADKVECCSSYVNEAMTGTSDRNQQKLESTFAFSDSRQ